MHHALKTTLALFFAGVIHSLAQTHEAATAALQDKSYKFTAPEAIELKNRIIAKDKVSEQEADFVMEVVNTTDAPAKEKTAGRIAALTALVEKGSVKSLASLQRTKGFSRTSPEAVALKEHILTKEKVTEGEATYVRSVVNQTLKAASKTDGNTPEQAAARNALFIATLTELAEKGSVKSTAELKVKTRDYETWTPDLIKARPEEASRLALVKDSQAAYRQLVFETLLKTQITDSQWQNFFKQHRKELPLARQIEVTAAMKNNMLSIAQRSNAADAFLASLSADLLALQLDQ